MSKSDLDPTDFTWRYISPVVNVTSLVLIILIALIIPSTSHSSVLRDDQEPKLYENLAIEIPSSHPQEIVLSNGNATHFTGESNKLETRKWHGLVHRDVNYLTNIWQNNLDENDVNTTILKPISSIIKYQDGSEETWFMPDGLPGISYQLETDEEEISLIPTFAMRIDYYSASSLDYYTFLVENGVFYITSTGADWLAIVANIPFDFTESKVLLNREFAKDDLRKDGSVTENVFQAGNFVFAGNSVQLSMGIGLTKNDALDVATTIRDQIDTLKVEKINRLKSLINQNQFQGRLIEFPSLNLRDALAWNLISLDKLTMQRFGPGLYAGYHWFDNYWGRDTFISFEGALLVPGKFEMARDVLRNMANLQKNESSSYYHGRVPNLVSVENEVPNYSTADGTGWFVYSIRKYLEITRDLSFANEMVNHVVLAIQGEMSRSDSQGLVTHQDRDTWMDAQTNGVIQTPRGDRAVEIQALFYQMYETLEYITEITGQTTILGDLNRIKQSKSDLLNAIKENYWNEEEDLIYDHLNPDNSKDLQKRPNLFIALRLLPNFIPQHRLFAMFNVYQDLITTHGIRTLVPSDPNYKSTHDGSSWHHDMAYHNGDVWPWLAGSVIDVALDARKFDIVSNLIRVHVLHSLEKNPVGGIGEIFDGTASDDGESVGALLQLWSMAEFVRTLVVTSSGFRVNDTTLHFDPIGVNYFEEFSLPVNTYFGNGRMDYQQNRFSFSGFNEGATIEMIIPNQFIGKDVLLNGIQIEPTNSLIEFTSTGEDVVIFIDPDLDTGNQVSNSTTKETSFWFGGLAILSLIVRKILQYLD